jgi:citrate lyase beta subunit
VIELVQAEGAAQIDGKMIDIAHKRIAERILLRAGLRPGSG